VIHLTAAKRQELNQLFALNRKVFKAYLLKESLDWLWMYHYEGANGQLPPTLDSSTPLAEIAALSEAGRDAG